MRAAVLVLLLAATAAYGGESEAIPARSPEISPALPVAAPSAACVSDAPHEGLIAALKATAEAMPKEADQRAQIEAAIVLIDSYAAGRVKLCGSLDAAARLQAALEAERDGWRRLYDQEAQASELWHQSYLQASRQAVKGASPGRLTRPWWLEHFHCVAGTGFGTIKAQAGPGYVLDWIPVIGACGAGW